MAEDPLSQKRLDGLMFEANQACDNVGFSVINEPEGSTILALLAAYRDAQHQRYGACGCVKCLEGWHLEDREFINELLEELHLTQAVVLAAERYRSGKCLLNEVVESTDQYRAWKNGVINVEK